MQNSDPAARPGSKNSGPAGVLRTLTNDAGLMLGTGEAITLFCVLAAGLRTVFERYWLGSMVGPPGLERRWYRLVLDCGEMLASLMQCRYL